jgi:hypothetical protein
MFQRLPIEIIKKIMQYDGRFKYQNGRFISQISKNDNRYTLLSKIPRATEKRHTAVFEFYSIVFFNNKYEYHKQKRLDVYSYRDYYPYVDLRGDTYSNSGSDSDEDYKNDPPSFIVEYCYWHDMLSNTNKKDIFLRD